VTLFGVLVHVLTETNRHAGHADILREQLDHAIGSAPDNAIRLGERDDAFWAKRRADIERAARSAAP
jgi:Protein of unknown function (DUF664)